MYRLKLNKLITFFINFIYKTLINDKIDLTLKKSLPSPNFTVII